MILLIFLGRHHILTLTRTLLNFFLFCSFFWCCFFHVVFFILFCHSAVLLNYLSLLVVFIKFFMEPDFYGHLFIKKIKDDIMVCSIEWCRKKSLLEVCWFSFSFAYFWTIFCALLRNLTHWPNCYFVYYEVKSFVKCNDFFSVK